MGRVHVLLRASASLRESGASEAAPEVVAEAKVEAHRLTGSLGSFGFVEGSDIAGEIEELLTQAFDGGQEWIDRLETKIIALQAYMEAR